MSTLRPILLSVCTVAALAGCASSDEKRLAEDSRPEAARAALDLLAAERPAEAAAEYLRLAASASGEAAAMYRLEAADAFVAAGDLDRARDLLEETAAPVEPQALKLRRDLVGAGLDLAEGRPTDALAALPPEVIEEAPAELVPRMRARRASAFDDVGNYLEAARERVLAGYGLTNPAQIAANQRAIWASLSRLSPQALSAIQTSPPDALDGWVELRRVASDSAGDPRRLEASLQTWASRYPGHPAGGDFLSELVSLTRDMAQRPQKIAILLPFDGPFQHAARAVRDGFLAAWFEDASGETQPVLIFRDSTRADISLLHQQVVEEGAQFVVGPLQRSTVSQLGSGRELSVPTLALNYADEAGEERSSNTMAPPPAPRFNFYQFALSPEDEARRVAERAWFDGNARAAVVAPEGSWGERVQQAFASEWEKLGGVVVATQSFAGDAKDMSNPVRRLLNVDRSEARATALRRALGTRVQFEPRRRQDIDFIFMAAFPQQARQLRPQFKFHHAARVPVYSTSHVFTGIPNAKVDGDLDGITFGDMPWVLSSGPERGSLQSRVARLWGAQYAKYARLYAFGADAYRLVFELPRLRSQHGAEFEGVTGTLSMDDRQRVQRRMTWVRFAGGVPREASGETPRP